MRVRCSCPYGSEQLATLTLTEGATSSPYAVRAAGGSLFSGLGGSCALGVNYLARVRDYGGPTAESWVCHVGASGGKVRYSVRKTLPLAPAKPTSMSIALLNIPAAADGDDCTVVPVVGTVVAAVHGLPWFHVV